MNYCKEDFNYYNQQAIFIIKNQKGHDDFVSFLVSITFEIMEEYKKNRRRTDVFDALKVPKDNISRYRTLLRSFDVYVQTLKHVSNSKYDYTKEKIQNDKDNYLDPLIIEKIIEDEAKMDSLAFSWDEMIVQAITDVCRTRPKLKFDIAYKLYNFTVGMGVKYLMKGSIKELCFDLGYPNESKKSLVYDFIKALARRSGGVLSYYRTQEVQRRFPDMRSNTMPFSKISA